MKRSPFLFSISIFSLLLLSCQSNNEAPVTKSPASYSDLVTLFKEWRTFEKPPMLKGAPDYTASTFEKRWPDFKKLQTKLLAMDTAGWQTPEKVDWMIVWAEMNGYDFNHRILKPWERDPAFYLSLWTERSDVPAHEGPTHHGITELWKYSFPLDASQKNTLISELRTIPSLNEQAKQNLTGNAKELWIAGIRIIQFQSEELKKMLKLSGVKSDNELVTAINEAIASTDSLVSWLQKEAPSKTGPSGIGKENYTWFP